MADQVHALLQVCSLQQQLLRGRTPGNLGGVQGLLRLPQQREVVMLPRACRGQAGLVEMRCQGEHAGCL